MSGRYLVLGATGNVGSGVVEGLAAKGLSVVAATRDPASAKLPAGVKAVRFDVADATSWDAALDGAEALFLLSPPGVVDAAGLLGPFLTRALAVVKRVVFMSADGVQYNDEIPLRRVELQIERSGVGYAFIRPSWFMQNFHTFWWPGVQATGSILVPAADSRTAFIDTRDIALAAVAALTAPQAPDRGFSISGPESLTYAEAAAILTAETGRAIGYQDISPAAFAAALEQAGLPLDYVAMLNGMFDFVRQGSASAISPEFEALVGHPPRSLAQFARDHKAIYAA